MFRKYSLTGNLALTLNPNPNPNPNKLLSAFSFYRRNQRLLHVHLQTSMAIIVPLLIMRKGLKLRRLILLIQMAILIPVTVMSICRVIKQMWVLSDVWEV